jgi:hypothetical protein
VRLLSPTAALLSTALLASTWIACEEGGASGNGPARGGDDDVTRPEADAEADADDEGTDGADAAAETDAAGSFDAAARDTTPDASLDTRCRDVDVLFVVDNSGSMADNQRSVIASFDGFITAMRTQLIHARSYHVGVVTSDDNFGNGEGCTEIGSLVTRTSGPESSNATCGPWDGRRYMDGLDPDLDAAFACAAQVGAGGSDDERVMRGLLNAVSTDFNAPGGCNEGFLRPDSLLIVVILTDEDDVNECEGVDDPFCDSFGSGGRPDDWLAEFVGYRPDALENTVVAALVGRRADNPCGAVVNSRVFGFANRFGERGYAGDICDETYDAFFAGILPLLDDACKLQ